MKRQEAPREGGPPPTAVVCVVPSSHRSPPGQPLFSSAAGLTSQASSAAAAGMVPRLPQSAGGGGGGPPTAAHQPPPPPPPGQQHVLTGQHAPLPAGQQPHLGHGLLPYQHSALSTAHAAYGENLSIKQEPAFSSAGAAQPANTQGSHISAVPAAHQHGLPVQHVLASSSGAPLSGSLHTLSSTSAGSVHLTHTHALPIRRPAASMMVGGSAPATVGGGSKAGPGVGMPVTGAPSTCAAGAASPGSAAAGVALTAGAAPPPSAAGGSDPSAQPSYQRLKVEDALSYLDQVKSKFQNNPEVYNDFLDIMKEFKAQNIDTPGVITRVSGLFRGHPALIVGFNTFLPPGYKIEVQSRNDYLHVSMTAPGQVTTVVHTPTGDFKTYSSDTAAPGAAPPPPPPVMPAAPAAVPPKPAHPPPQSPASQTLSRGGYGTNNIVSGLGGPSGAGSGHHVTAHHSYNQPPPAALGGLAALTQGAGAGTGAAAAALTTPGAAQPAAAAPPPPPPQPGAPAPQSQPVEFNHAINYVNKIKNRFQSQPEIYKQFLEILHTYQKDQKCLKDGVPPTGPALSETEVFAKVAALFQNHEDLMDEFGQFLPDATNGNAISAVNNSRSVTQEQHPAPLKKPMKPSFQPQPKPLKRPVPAAAPPPPVPPAKKPRVGVLKDVTLAEAGKYALLNEYAFFDEVRKTLKNQEAYNNFLRVLSLYNNEIISRLDVIQLLTPFLSKHPGMLKWLKDFMGVKEGRETVEPLPMNVAKQERVSGDQAIEIDYSTCKRLGASYCALPKSYPQPRCTGRTALCREVLNDTWVSFPSYSEDSTFVTSRKTQYEEYIYRCEDERFELDMVLETNFSTIRILEGVQKKLSRMAPEDAARYRLDDCLGGTSPTVHQRAVRRIYGDRASDIIDGLKKNPIVAVPVVLRRLKAKQDEWREAQKGYNKIWREQNEKYYLKSLDPQGINFKQNDVKMLRSKSLLNELYTLFDERHEAVEEAGGDPAASGGPHTECVYENKHLLNDAANLIIHHVKRQTTIQKEDKAKMKLLLRQTLPGMFYHPKQELSDDERDDDDEADADDESDDEDGSERRTRSQKVLSRRAAAAAAEGRRAAAAASAVGTSTPSVNAEAKSSGAGGGVTAATPAAGASTDDDPAAECYTLFMASSNWYLFLRLHHILCQRLGKIYERAVIMAREEEQHKKLRSESAAIALRLKPKNEIEVEDYYPAFLDMVKSVLDNNMDSSQFEDTLREMFGIHAYNAFTADKIVQGCVRQLQHIVSENVAQLTLKEYLLEASTGGAGGPCATAEQRDALETAYIKRVEAMLTEENEHCMKIYLFKNAGRMTIELLDTTDNEDSEAEFTEEKRRSTYQEKYASPAHHTDDEVKPTPPPAQGAAADAPTPRDATGTAKPAAGGLQLPHFLARVVRRSRRIMLEQRPSGDERADRRQQPDGKTDDGDGDKTPTSSADRDNDDDQSGAEQDTGYGAASPDAPARARPAPLPVRIDGGEHFRLGHDYRMTQIQKNESFLYRQNAIPKARRMHPSVSARLRERFHGWHSDWLEAHVSARQRQVCTDWLLGRVDGIKPSRTSVLRDNPLSKPPYVAFSRYRVEWLEAGGGAQGAAAAGGATATAATNGKEDPAVKTELDDTGK